MDDLHSFCSWHCSCKSILSNRPQALRVTTIFSDKSKRQEFITNNKVVLKEEIAKVDGNKSGRKRKVSDALDIDVQNKTALHTEAEHSDIINGSTCIPYSNGLSNSNPEIEAEAVLIPNGKTEINRFRNRFLSPAKRSSSPLIASHAETPVERNVENSFSSEILEPQQGTTEVNNVKVEETNSSTEESSNQCENETVQDASPSAETLKSEEASDQKPNDTTTDALAGEENAIEVQAATETDLNPKVNTDTPISDAKTPIKISNNGHSSRQKSASVVATPSSAYNCRNRSQFHKCGSCGKMFAQESSLKLHEKEHLLESSKNCECVECGKSYTTVASYQRHLKSHTKCLLCGKGITKSQKEKQVGRDGLEVNVCTSCRKEDLHKPIVQSVSATASDFSDSDSNGPSESDDSEFTDDNLDQASNYQQQYPCSVCGKNFKLLSNLQLHYSLHKTDSASNLDFPCRYCGQGFATSALMKKHEAIIHRLERKYKCSFCPARFKENHHKTRHEDRLH